MSDTRGVEKRLLNLQMERLRAVVMGGGLRATEQCTPRERGRERVKYVANILITFLTPCVSLCPFHLQLRSLVLPF